LETEQFSDLTECPGGFEITPFMKMKSTLDPYDPRSIQLVEEMIMDLIPNFSSDYFNVFLDEPFELGHWQYLPVSYAGFVVGGGLSWNSKGYNESLLEDYLDVSVYKDLNKVMGSFSLDLERYNQFEEIFAPNMTLINLGFQFGLMDQVLYQTILNSFPSTFTKLAPADMVNMIYERFKLRQPYDFQGLLDYLDVLERELDDAELHCLEADLITSEFRNAIAFIRVGATLKNYIEQEQKMSRMEKIEYLQKFKDEYSVFLNEHKRLWLSRNKSGGLVARSWERLKDRTFATAAAVIL
jgi:hypothetical protein